MWHVKVDGTSETPVTMVSKSRRKKEVHLKRRQLRQKTEVQADRIPEKPGTAVRKPKMKTGGTSETPVSTVWIEYLLVKLALPSYII